MEKPVDLDASVYSLCERYPEMKHILHGIGFNNIVNPGMLNTVGRFMTLARGSEMKKIPLQEIIDALKTNGFTVQERKANI